MNSKVVFKVKAREDNTIEKYKTRLTACGYSLVKGIDYDESFAPVANTTSVKIVIERAAAQKYKLHKIDITTAYLYAKLDEKQTIYMRLPKEVNQFGINMPPGHHAKLQNNIYGLPTAGRAWNKELHNTLTTLRFKRTTPDPCLYHRKEKDNSTTLLAVVVDDILMTSKEQHTIDKFILQLQTRYELTHEHRPREFLRNKITYHDNDDISLSQYGYVQQLLADYHHTNCNGKHTPAIQNEHITPAIQTINNKRIRATEPLHNEEWTPHYRPLIGRLQYITCMSRPDIMYAVNAVSRHIRSPTNQAWNAAKRILQYLKHTQKHNYSIRFKGNTTQFNLNTDVDASYATTFDRKSVTGLLITINDAPLYWTTKIQNVTTQSACEAEYVSTNAAARNTRWIQHLYHGINIQCTSTITTRMHDAWKTYINSDNNGSIQLAYNPIIKSRSRHIEIRYHYTREQLENGHIKLTKIKGTDNKADIFTKPLGGTLFQKHSKSIFKNCILNNTTG